MDEILKAIFEFVFEIVLSFPGYLILRVVRRKEQIDPDGCLVFIVGFSFWVIIGLVIWGLVAILSR